MQTLLPKSELRHQKHEYRLRCLVLFLFVLSGTVWIGIISLFPAYIISVTQEHGAETEAGQIEAGRQTAGSGQIEAQIQDANSLIKTVASSQDSLFFSSLIEDIDSRRVPGMIITDFSLSHAGGTGNSAITISGIAATRSILVAFEDNLENDLRLTKVELPVSDLAEDTNISFSMSMQGVQ